MTRRSAFTLAELVVVLTAGSVLLTISITTVHRSMSIHRQGERHDRDHATVARLSREFRRDVRLAAAAELKAGVLTLIPADTKRQTPITYEVVEGRLVRRQPRAEGLERREVYEFGSNVEIALTRLPESSQIRLLIAAATSLEHEPTRLLLIVDATPGAGVPTP